MADFRQVIGRGSVRGLFEDVNLFGRLSGYREWALSLSAACH
jgi:hypothetical protein